MLRWASDVFTAVCLCGYMIVGLVVLCSILLFWICMLCCDVQIVLVGSGICLLIVCYGLGVSWVCLIVLVSLFFMLFDFSGCFVCDKLLLVGCGGFGGYLL